MTTGVWARTIVSSVESLSEAGEVILSTITYKHLALKEQGKLKKRESFKKAEKKSHFLFVV